jgi:hypothetical protein
MYGLKIDILLALSCATLVLVISNLNIALAVIAYIGAMHGLKRAEEKRDLKLK